jgi:hypothetical protein
MYDENRQLVPHPFDKCQENGHPPAEEHCVCGRKRDDEIHKVAAEVAA